LSAGNLEWMSKSQSTISDAFSRVVKKHREKCGLSRAGLAEKAGLHQTYIGLLEREKRRPNLDTAKAISNALGLPLAKLIAEAEKI
jgi:ribosome-binding protein aMBF1 (putative translation factor)